MSRIIFGVDFDKRGNYFSLCFMLLAGIIVGDLGVVIPTPTISLVRPFAP